MTRGPVRLHICLGTRCNNNCVFCMEEDREGRAERLGLIDTQAALRILESAASRDSVMFTAGEPSLRPDLPDLVRRASRMGFRQVGLISNGRRLAYPRYLHSLVRAGLNSIVISVHGHTAKLHDSQTRTPGSFEQTVAALSNVAAARAGGVRLRFSTATVLSLRNMDDVGAILDFLGGFAPDERIFNAIQPLGRSDRLFVSLVPRYTEMVAAFAAGLGQALRGIAGVRVEDVPACVTGPLPPAVVGFVENHGHYEPEAEILDGVGPKPHPAVGAGPVADAQGDSLALVTRERLDEVLRTKGPRCPECVHFGTCLGVWRRYVAAYGFDEFVPVR